MGIGIRASRRLVHIRWLMAIGLEPADIIILTRWAPVVVREALTAQKPAKP